MVVAAGIGVDGFDGQVGGREFFGDTFDREILKPVVDCAAAVWFDDGVFVDDDFFLVVFEGVYETVIWIGRPKAVELILFVGGSFLSVGKCREGVDIEEDGAARFQDAVKFVQHELSLCGAEGAKIAHDHQDQINLSVCFKIEVVFVDVGDV